jgi:hypothetical protein
VTHFFVQEEAQWISDRIFVVGIHVAVHIQDDRAVAYHWWYSYLHFNRKKSTHFRKVHYDESISPFRGIYFLFSQPDVIWNFRTMLSRHA